MQKSHTLLSSITAAAVILAGQGLAQQTPSTPAQSDKAPSAQTGKVPTKKTAPAKKAPVAHKPVTTSTLTLKTQKEKQSYALGLKVGGDLRKQGVNQAVDPALAGRGFRDALAGTKPLLTDDEERSALMQLQSEVHEQQAAKAHEAGAAARKQGEAFLADNKGKEGVTTLPSGLEYKILTEGKGPKPAATDTVTCNYRGTLLNGKEFDSSYARGKPESFPVNGVIKGWTEALQMMPVGSKWQLFIPSDLAYGDRGAGQDIGPGETLVFEVELLSIAEDKK